MRFSLIVATLDREEEPARLLASLSEQSFEDFEVFLVDQNGDDRLAHLEARYASRLHLLRVRSRPGASRARNVGLRQSSGDLVAFPDDDCWYPPDLLERVDLFFRDNPSFHGLTGTAKSPDGTPAGGRFSHRKGGVTRYNVWRRAVTPSMFFRREVADTIGGFDETLGVGADTPFRSGEDTDYPLRALASGFNIFYDPDLVVFHPDPVPRYDRAALARARSYAPGTGRVLRKHRYPLWFVAYAWLRPLAGAGLALIAGQPRRARHHLAVFRGRVSGWLARAEVERG